MANKIESLNAKKEILTSEFHQYFNIKLDKDLSVPDNQFVNVTIPFEKILNTEDEYGLGNFLKYFNNDFSNILITHADNFNIIHQFECYKNVLFIRLQPYTQNIALHIIPKIYDTTDNILFFKDDNINDNSYTSDSNNHYIRYKDEQHSPINLYFNTQNKNDSNEQQARNPEMKPYPEFDKFDNNPKTFFEYENDDEEYIWDESPYSEAYGEYNFDIRNRLSNNMQNVQINAGYRYNNSSPTNAIHYLGTKDVTNNNLADRCTLIDTNYDNITQNSNVIKQFEIKNNQIVFPTTASPLNNGFTHDSGLHSDNIGKLYHKTVKYFNDEIYSEEYDGTAIKFINADWNDLDGN